jgi:hypothetical protein
MQSNEIAPKGGAKRFTLARVGGVGLALALPALFLYFEALTVGYVVATLLLSAFFVVVAFDIGVDRRPVVVQTEAADALEEPRRR